MACSSTIELASPPKLINTDKCLVVLVRPYLSYGALAKVPIEVDNHVVGKLANDAYMYFYMDPGEHRIFGLKASGGLKPITAIKENFLPGKSYYYVLNWDADMPPLAVTGNIIHFPKVGEPRWIELDSETGRSLIASMKNSPTADQLKE